MPVVPWLDSIPQKAADKCIARLRRLAAMGYELRRPEADLLRDGIYELRVGFQGIHYRMLYFFHRNLTVVVSQGLVKQRAVPPIEIERAIQRKSFFSAAPDVHSAEFPYGWAMMDRNCINFSAITPRQASVEEMANMERRRFDLRAAAAPNASWPPYRHHRLGVCRLEDPDYDGLLAMFQPHRHRPRQAVKLNLNPKT